MASQGRSRRVAVEITVQSILAAQKKGPLTWPTHWESSVPENPNQDATTDYLSHKLLAFDSVENYVAPNFNRVTRNIGRRFVRSESYGYEEITTSFDLDVIIAELLAMDGLETYVTGTPPDGLDDTEHPIRIKAYESVYDKSGKEAARFVYYSEGRLSVVHRDAIGTSGLSVSQSCTRAGKWLYKVGIDTSTLGTNAEDKLTALRYVDTITKEDWSNGRQLEYGNLTDLIS